MPSPKTARILLSVMVLLAGLSLGSVPAAASAPAAACERAALAVSAETGVPADILSALTLTETGRQRDGIVRPWAWSVNAEGSGTWFDDPGRALAFAEDRVAQGRGNLDIGCFQINYRWHGQNFASVADMFDPVQNARYAARFLSQLHDETGDWRAAAGAFHSRSPGEAAKYLRRFDDLRATLSQQGWAGLTAAQQTYNRFAAEAGAGADAEAGADAGTVIPAAPGTAQPALVPIPLSPRPEGMGRGLMRDRRAGPRLMLAEADAASASRDRASEVAVAAVDPDPAANAPAEDFLGVGVEVPVPDMTAGAGPVDVDLGGGGRLAAVDAAGPSEAFAARMEGTLDASGMPEAVAAADPASGWQPNLLPGEAQAPIRQRRSRDTRTLLGAAQDDTLQPSGGSLALLGPSRGAILRGGGPLFGGTAVASAEP